MVEAVEKFAKGAEMMAHSLVLMSNQVKELQAANKAALHRTLCKRKRIKAEGTLTAEEGVRLSTLKEFAAHSDGKKAKKRVRIEAGEPSQRRCGRCGKAGHNARTCRQEVVIDSE